MRARSGSRGRATGTASIRSTTPARGSPRRLSGRSGQARSGEAAEARTGGGAVRAAAGLGARTGSEGVVSRSDGAPEWQQFRRHRAAVRWRAAGQEWSMQHGLGRDGWRKLLSNEVKYAVSPKGRLMPPAVLPWERL